MAQLPQPKLVTVKASGKPKYSIFVPFTRGWFVDDFLLNFQRMVVTWENAEVVFINDSANLELQEKLLAWLQKYKDNVDGAKLYTTNMPALGEHDLVSMRRERIVRIKQLSTELIGDSLYTFCLEDDTIAPLDALARLENAMQSDERVGLASGIQVGRWADPIIGAWQIEPLHEPTTVRTVPYRGMGWQPVDGTGWYCYLTRTELYKAADYRFEADCLGPDVCYGWDLRRQGYKVLVDWEVPCAHVTQSGSIYPDKDVRVCTWHKEGSSWIPL